MNERPDKTPEENVEKKTREAGIMSKRCRQCGCLLDDAFCSSECQQAFEKENPGLIKKEKMDDLKRKGKLIEWKSLLETIRFAGVLSIVLGMIFLPVWLIVRLMVELYKKPIPWNFFNTGFVLIVVGAIIWYIAGRIIVRIEKKLFE